MTRRSWLVGHEEAGRRRQARAAGRKPLDQAELDAVRDYYDTHSVADEIENAVWNEDWAPTPTMNRSVHMRPAETQHIPKDRRDSMLGRSLDWLISLMP